MPRKRIYVPKHCPPDVWLQIIESEKQGMSLGDLSKQFGFASYRIRNWLERYYGKTVTQRKEQREAQQVIEQIEEENDRLTADQWIAFAARVHLLRRQGFNARAISFRLNRDISDVYKVLSQNWQG